MMDTAYIEAKKVKAKALFEGGLNCCQAVFGAFAEDFGISFLLRAPMGLALVNNPLHSVVSDYMNKKFYEEIIRLLYVALTRAKEKLFVEGLIHAYCYYDAKEEYDRRMLEAKEYYFDKLKDFSNEEWEQICCNCGLCCLIKLQNGKIPFGDFRA